MSRPRRARRERRRGGPAGSRARPGRREELQPGQHGGEAERQVDQEDHPPAGAEQVGVDQPAYQHRAADRRQAHHRAEQPERGAHLLGGEHLLDHPDALRQHQRAEQALHGAGADEHAGETATPHSSEPRGRYRADDEHPLAAVEVAEAAAGDEPDRHRQRVEAASHWMVAADPPSSARIVGAAMLVISASSMSMISPHEDHEEGDPAPAVARVRGAGFAGRQCLGHDRLPSGTVFVTTNSVSNPERRSCQVRCSCRPSFSR